MAAAHRTTMAPAKPDGRDATRKKMAFTGRDGSCGQAFGFAGQRLALRARITLP
jgi:hypothetical protein